MIKKRKLDEFVTAAICLGVILPASLKNDPKKHQLSLG